MNSSAPNDQPELKLDLPAAHSAERMARAVLREFAKKKRMPAKEIETLEFVASELLSNAVDHGGGDHAMEESELPGDVRMSLALVVRADGWTMSVGDQGGGDPAEMRARIESPDEPDLEDERGRGFFLLAQMLERIEVEKTADGRGLLFTAVRKYAARR
ncbi:MAG: ATP-binding protein [Planctomycetota bacterium]|nr:ATP-binding protein [Planctomycetota bacterium]